MKQFYATTLYLFHKYIVLLWLYFSKYFVFVEWDAGGLAYGTHEENSDVTNQQKEERRDVTLLWRPIRGACAQRGQHDPPACTENMHLHTESGWVLPLSGL